MRPALASPPALCLDILPVQRSSIFTFYALCSALWRAISPLGGRSRLLILLCAPLRLNRRESFPLPQFELAHERGLSAWTVFVFRAVLCGPCVWSIMLIWVVRFFVKQQKYAGSFSSQIGTHTGAAGEALTFLVRNAVGSVASTFASASIAERR